MKCFVLWGVTLATVLCLSRAATFTTQFSDSRYPLTYSLTNSLTNSHPMFLSLSHTLSRLIWRCFFPVVLNLCSPCVRNMVCNQQDGEFYSSVNYTCSACNASAHQVLDTRSGVDVNGNYASCRCQIGYLSVTAPCVVRALLI